MKKFISILLCVCMVLTMGLAVAADGVSGDFTGTAQGLGGDVTVTLTLKDGKIVGCTATGDKETEGIGSKVIDSFPAIVAESGSIAVDAISGATVTSNAFVAAAEAALTEAGLNPDDYMAKADKTANGETVSYDADVVVIGAGGAEGAMDAANILKPLLLIMKKNL